MPQTLAIWVTEVLLTVGVGTYTTAAVANAILWAGWGGIIAAGSAILNATGLLGGAPDIPRPNDNKIAKRQSVPPRMGGTGRARISGYYMCYEEMSGVSADVIALLNGKIDGFEAY